LLLLVLLLSAREFHKPCYQSCLCGCLLLLLLLRGALV
jgi:hypothetical protein